ncbi:hypothetical protein RFI_30904 [Reticulomyxa filosa]|uniref:Uncharacterized protein n=1 Tax=Reticulomyxa filosa TaxID=46433 RepID=X6M0I9_RETFI|nr:hypothetical protein RFI_30904 [Reticulomyxa filosa]|eukprot:ETO06490.1 hypothetical protein RFI_30904 [Reticulomyxa filosa]
MKRLDWKTILVLSTILGVSFNSIKQRLVDLFQGDIRIKKSCHCKHKHCLCFRIEAMPIPFCLYSYPETKQRLNTLYNDQSIVLNVNKYKVMNTAFQLIAIAIGSVRRSKSNALIMDPKCAQTTGKKCKIVQCCPSNPFNNELRCNKNTLASCVICCYNDKNCCILIALLIFNIVTFLKSFFNFIYSYQ